MAVEHTVHSAAVLFAMTKRMSFSLLCFMNLYYWRAMIRQAVTALIESNLLFKAEGSGARAMVTSYHQHHHDHDHRQWLSQLTVWFSPCWCTSPSASTFSTHTLIGCKLNSIQSTTRTNTHNNLLWIDSIEQICNGDRLSDPLEISTTEH